MSGQWVVDYGNTLINNIQHKEFDTEEEAIEWGKSLIGQTYTVTGQTYPINYIHKVYEPIWHNESDIPIEDVLTTEEYDAPADQVNIVDAELSSEQTETDMPASEVEEEEEEEEEE